jgi:hypothetical protein
MTNVRDHATTAYDTGDDRPLSAAYVDKIFRPVLMSNLEHIVGDIHNILKAYYKPARERFVDTICWTTISSQALTHRYEYSLRILSTNQPLHNVERLNEHSLEDCLDRQKATAIYIVGGWVCHDFNTQYCARITNHTFGQTYVSHNL